MPRFMILNDIKYSYSLNKARSKIKHHLYSNIKMYRKEFKDVALMIQTKKNADIRI